MTTFVRLIPGRSVCLPPWREDESQPCAEQQGHRGRALACFESDLPYEATDRGDCPTVRARSEPAKGLLRSLPQLSPSGAAKRRGD